MLAGRLHHSLPVSRAAWWILEIPESLNSSTGDWTCVTFTYTHEYRMFYTPFEWFNSSLICLFTCWSSGINTFCTGGRGDIMRYLYSSWLLARPHRYPRWDPLLFLSSSSSSCCRTCRRLHPWRPPRGIRPEERRLRGNTGGDRERSTVKNNSVFRNIKRTRCDRVLPSFRSRRLQHQRAENMDEFGLR